MASPHARLSSVVRVLNESKGTELGERVRVAQSLWSRGRGLMFKQELEPGTGLLIDPCGSIHTMWMRFAIDVVYVDRAGRVMRADSEMRPWRVGPLVRGGRFVIELPPGAIRASRTEVGDDLRIEPQPA